MGMIKHSGDAVESKPIKFEFVNPEAYVRQQESEHFHSSMNKMDHEFMFDTSSFNRSILLGVVEASAVP
jgi:hypothetical protein